MKISPRARLLAVPALCVLLAAGSETAFAAGPLEEIRSTVDAIMEVLKDKAIPKEERTSKISSMVKDRFDFRTMAQGILATNWKKASEEEKDRFVELFSELLETTYRNRIDAYNNEKVEYVKEQVKGRRASVETMVITTDVEIPVEYKLLEKGGEWKAYDVVIEGVSLVRNYRDSYKDIVSKEGMNGLLAKMEQKIEEIRLNPEAGKTP